MSLFRACLFVFVWNWIMEVPFMDKGNLLASHWNAIDESWKPIDEP